MNKKKLFDVFAGLCLVFILIGVTFETAFSNPVTPTKEARIHILSNVMGSASYVLSFGLVDIINKNSSWLRATGVETSGAVENIKLLGLEPKKRKNTVIVGEAVGIHQGKMGELPGYDKKYDSLKMASSMMLAAQAFATLNKDIKKGNDLVGKRVAIGAKGWSGWQMAHLTMKYGWGIWDRVKIESLGFNDGKDALSDGLVDVAAQGPIQVGPGKWKGNPALQELIASKNPYFVDIDKEAIEKARAKSGYPLIWVEIPGGELCSNQTNSIGALGHIAPWCVDAEMEDEIVYELCRVIYENASKFASYHVLGNAITPEGMAAIPGTSKSDFHSGAIKFYQERKVKFWAE